MFKKAITYVILASLWITTGFTGDKGAVWQAYLELEGQGKKIILTSNAIYGSYSPNEKKYFFFGKNHMFVNSNDLESTKIFNDLCITNASGQFEFELNNISDPSKDQTGISNISFKKKTAGNAKIKNLSDGSQEVSYSGNFKNLGFTLTKEAAKIMTGEFKLVFKSQK
jgi:hypothetical protein